MKAEIQDFSSISVRLNRQQRSFVYVYVASFPGCPEAGRRLLKLVVCFTALLKFEGPWRSNLRSDGPSPLSLGNEGKRTPATNLQSGFFFFGERAKRSPDASRVICSSLIKASVDGVILSDFTGNSSCSEVG